MMWQVVVIMLAWGGERDLRQEAVAEVRAARAAMRAGSGDPRVLWAALLDLAAIERRRHALDEALWWAEAALTLEQTLSSPRPPCEGRAATEVGRILVAMGHPEAAALVRPADCPPTPRPGSAPSCARGERASRSWARKQRRSRR